MRHDALEPVRMRQHPVRHVPAIARPQRTLPRLVHKRVLRLRIVQTLHQVDIRPAAPIAAHFIDKLLPIPRRTTPIDAHHHIPIRRHQLPVPPKAPRIPPSRLRPTMHQELHRIFLRRIKIRRLHHEALNLRAFRADEPEGLQRGQGQPIKKRFVQMSDLSPDNLRPSSTPNAIAPLKITIASRANEHLCGTVNEHSNGS